jgi:AmiR/NasT family two-component response regulator
MQRVQDALATRVAIEQAKGVIAELENVPMNRAYALLMERAAESGKSLTDTARAVIEGAQRR